MNDRSDEAAAQAAERLTYKDAGARCARQWEPLIATIPGKGRAGVLKDSNWGTAPMGLAEQCALTPATRAKAIAAAQATVAQKRNDDWARVWMLKSLAKLDPAGAKAFAVGFLKDESVHVAGTVELMTKE